jgi:hypothetical protein
VKANRAYHLIVTKGSALPGRLAGDHPDKLEIVEVATQEVVLFWQLPRKEAQQLRRRLRRDLLDMEADEFIAAWGE